LLPEFEDELKESPRLPVEEFAEKLSSFFMKQWDSRMPKGYTGQDISFLVGGYDEGAPYGRVFEVFIPQKPKPNEWHKDGFGITWGGQREFADRLINGYDDSLLGLVQKFAGLTDAQMPDLRRQLGQLGVAIPYPFLPLQDCVDIAIFLVRTTRTIQNWLVGVRGVGGAIDVATVTRIEGFKAIQQKSLLGER
jgi:hypothetical protein